MQRHMVRAAWPCVVDLCCGVAVLSLKMGGRCVLSFKMGFWVRGSRGVRDVQIGVAVTNPVRIKAVYGKCKIPKKRVPIYEYVVSLSLWLLCHAITFSHCCVPVVGLYEHLADGRHPKNAATVCGSFQIHVLSGFFRV